MNKSNNKNNVTRLIKHQLQKLRKNRRLSEEQAAIKTGFSIQDYLAIEQGARRVSLETLAKLALAFNVEVSDLLPSMLDLKKIRSRK